MESTKKMSLIENINNTKLLQWSKKVCWWYVLSHFKDEMRYIKTRKLKKNVHKMINNNKMESTKKAIEYKTGSDPKGMRVVC